MSFWSDLVAGIEGATGITGAIHLAEGIWASLTDGKLWRSLGWLLLGVVLMLLGVLWWIGPSAARRSPAGIAAGALT